MNGQCSIIVCWGSVRQLTMNITDSSRLFHVALLSFQEVEGKLHLLYDCIWKEIHSLTFRVSPSSSSYCLSICLSVCLYVCILLSFIFYVF